MEAPPSPLFQLELPIREAWSNAEGLRTAVIRCLETVYEAREGCEIYGMVVAELVENAIKFGRWQRLTQERSSKLQLEGDNQRVCIEVIHPVAPGSSSLPSLFETMKLLRSGLAPAAIYRQKLEAVAAGHEGIGLGLAR